MLEGTLDSFTLTEILRLLASTGKTGCLHVRSRRDQGRVWLRDGEVQHAALGEGRLPLSRRLVGAGIATVDDIRQALPAGGDELQLIRTLVEDGVLDAGALEAFRRQQMEDAAFDLMRWDEGTFRFDTTADQLALSAVAVEDLLDECHRRLEEWEAVRSAIPGRDAVVAVAASFADAREEVQLALTADEWRLLSLVDGRRTVGEVAELSGQGEFRTCTLLIGLIDAGVVAVRQEGGVLDLPRQQELLRQLEETISGSDRPPAPASGAPARGADPVDDEVHPLAPQRPRHPLPPPQAPQRGVPRRMDADVDPGLIDRLIEGVKGL